MNETNHALMDHKSYIYTPDVKMKISLEIYQFTILIEHYNNGKIFQMLDWFPGVKGAFSLMGKVDTALINQVKI